MRRKRDGKDFPHFLERRSRDQLQPLAGHPGHPQSLHKGTAEAREATVLILAGLPDIMRWALQPRSLILYFYTLLFLSSTCLAVSMLLHRHIYFTWKAEK